MYISLKTADSSKENFLHLIFPKDYVTTQEIWDDFLEGKRLLTFPKGEQIENWSKYLLMYWSLKTAGELFTLNDQIFNSSGQKMIDIKVQAVDANCFAVYMEYLNLNNIPYFEHAMYFDLKEINGYSGSFMCAYCEKLDKILDSPEFLDKISHLEEVIPYEIELLNHDL